jgi:pyrroloquinoline quinone biosynthesis protein D
MTELVLTRPRLASGVRLRWDEVRGRHVLLFPEGMLALNATAAAVLELCDGERSLFDIVGELSSRYSGADVRDDVEDLVSRLARLGLVIDADG